MVGVMVLFALVGVAIVLETGDLASVAGAAVNGRPAPLLLFQGRRQLLRATAAGRRSLLVAVMLLVVLVRPRSRRPFRPSARPRSWPSAFALSFLSGRRLAVALVAAFLVSIAAAIMVEMTPASPDLPPELSRRSSRRRDGRRHRPRRTRPVPPPRSARGAVTRAQAPARHCATARRATGRSSRMSAR